MDLERLETKRSKVIFGTIVALLLFLLFFILHYEIYPNLNGGGHKYSLLKSIIETLFSSLAVAVIMGGFLVWASPRKVAVGEQRILQPHEIYEHHKKCRKDTRNWWYDGGTGRYTRDETLPSLAQECKKQRKTMCIHLYILDPGNSDVCKIYADYYSKLVNPEKVVTESDTRCDLLATIVSAYFWKRNLDINVYLKGHFSIFKREFSDNMVLVTRDDETKPAMVYSKGSEFYEAYKTELNYERQFYTELPNVANWGTGLKNYKKIPIENIKELLKQLQLDQGVTDSDLKEIQYLVKTKTSPYA